MARTWRFWTSWVVLFLLVIFAVAEVQARGGRGGGGGGGFHGGGGGGGGGFSSGGPASRGSFSGSRSYDAGQQGATNRQINRQDTAKQLQARDRAGQAANREDWQQYGREQQESRQQAAKERQNSRQDYAHDAREDWQEYGDDHWRGGYRGGGYYNHPVAAGMAVGAAVAVGTAITASAFSALTCTPTTVVVGAVSYYSCGGTWYTREYQGGNVTYVVVNPPAGY